MKFYHITFAGNGIETSQKLKCNKNVIETYRITVGVTELYYFQKQ